MTGAMKQRQYKTWCVYYTLCPPTESYTITGSRSIIQMSHMILPKETEWLTVKKWANTQWRPKTTAPSKVTGGTEIYVVYAKM